MTLVGCSRSGRDDFLKAAQLLEDKHFQRRLKVIVYDAGVVSKVGDIFRVFADDLNTSFKTVFKWEV